MSILNLQRRYRELGRIRMGKKTGNRPSRLDTWRLTTSNRHLLDVAAGLWGGHVTEWRDAPTEGTFELVTDTDRLPIVIPPGRDPVTQWMEQWTAGGCTHRCDTQRNVITDEPCSCDLDNPLCKPTTRLVVMLPDLPDVGVWRLETHGWNAANELPGTLDLLGQAAQHGQFLDALLRIEQRRAVRDGQTSRFAVPVIDLDVTVRQLTSGQPVPQVPASTAAAPAATALPAGEQQAAVITEGQRRRLFAVAKQAGWEDRDAIKQAIQRHTGRTSTSAILASEYDLVIAMLEQGPPTDPTPAETAVTPGWVGDPFEDAPPLPGDDQVIDGQEAMIP